MLGAALVYHAILDGDREAAERSRSLAEFNVRYAADSNWSSLEQANSVANLALSLYALGEYPASIATAQRSLHEMPRDIGAIAMWPVFLVGLVVCESGLEVGRGVTLVTAALKQSRDEGMPEDFWVRLMRERNEREARITLGDDGYEAAVRAGEALSRDDAIELALSPIDLPTAPGERAPSS